MENENLTNEITSNEVNITNNFSEDVQTEQLATMTVADNEPDESVPDTPTTNTELQNQEMIESNEEQSNQDSAVPSENVPEAEAPSEPPVQSAEEQITTEETEPTAALAETSEIVEAVQTEKHEEKTKKIDRFAPIYEELSGIKDRAERIEVQIKDRIRGGLRAVYKGAPLFLPASHFSLRRTPSEQELTDSINSTMLVEIHEIQEYEEGRKAVIVSRKNILTDEFWNKINIGDIIEGKVSSIASFGVFLDLGGIEGLIHISRLSQVHVDDPSKLIKKGDIMQAVVVELNKEKDRIALSRKELEDSPWKNIDEEYPAGTVAKGKVRRLTEFGAYIEIKPGVDGLLRTQEISWTKRVKRPSDFFKTGSEIDVMVLSVNPDKRTMALSYKQVHPNPWSSMVDKYPVGSEYDGIVFQVMPQGMIVTVQNEIDGFIPRSKMKKVMQGNKIPYQAGDALRVYVADINPDEQALILAPKYEEDPEAEQRRAQKYAQAEAAKQKNKGTGISLLDMLSDDDKKDLIKSV